MTGAAEWIQPIPDYRAAREKMNGSHPLFNFPRINHLWGLDGAESSPYSAARGGLSILRAALGGQNGESYTLHSPKNLFPTASNQMNCNTRELNITGRWSSSSKMPERYDRAVCAAELLLSSPSSGRLCMVGSSRHRFACLKLCRAIPESVKASHLYPPSMTMKSH